MPQELQAFLAINREFFEDGVTGWGSPRGADTRYTTDKDHPVVAAWPKRDAV